MGISRRTLGKAALVTTAAATGLAGGLQHKSKPVKPKKEEPVQRKLREAKAGKKK